MNPWLVPAALLSGLALGSVGLGLLVILRAAALVSAARAPRPRLTGRVRGRPAVPLRDGRGPGRGDSRDPEAAALRRAGSRLAQTRLQLEQTLPGPAHAPEG